MTSISVTPALHGTHQLYIGYANATNASVDALSLYTTLHAARTLVCYYTKTSLLLFFLKVARGGDAMVDGDIIFNKFNFELTKTPVATVSTGCTQSCLLDMLESASTIGGFNVCNALNGCLFALNIGNR